MNKTNKTDKTDIAEFFLTIVLPIQMLIFMILLSVIVITDGLKSHTVCYKTLDILPLPISDEYNISDENKKMYLFKISVGESTAYKLFIDIDEKDNTLILHENEVEIEFITSGELPYIEYYKRIKSRYNGLKARRITIDYYYYKIYIPQDSIMEYNY